MNELKKYIKQAVSNNNLTMEQAARAMQIIILNGATPAQIAAYLTALASKKIITEEIIGSVIGINSKINRLNYQEPTFVFRCTGKTNSELLNITLPVNLIIAAAGVKVVDFGNKSVVSNSTADLLHYSGVNIENDYIKFLSILDKTNYAYILENNYIKRPRDLTTLKFEIGIATIFDIIAPFLAPIQPTFQIVGVYDRNLLQPIAEALQYFNVQKAWVVSGEDSIDKLTINNISYIAELNNNKISYFTIKPEDAGIATQDIQELQTQTLVKNAKSLANLLSGHKNIYRDMVLLNSAASLLVNNKVKNLPEGVKKAATIIDTGLAKEILNKIAFNSNMNLLNINNEDLKVKINETQS